MSICGLRMTKPAEEALDSGVHTAEDEDSSVCGESAAAAANGEKKPECCKRKEVLVHPHANYGRQSLTFDF